MNWHTRFLQQSHWTQALRRYLYNRIHLDNDQRILEVGCGTGAVLLDFSSPSSTPRNHQGYPIRSQIHGLDIDPVFLSQASQNISTVSLTQGDAHLLPYATSSFNLVFCHFLLMWVHDPVRVVTEMIRVTRSGGYVLALAEPDYGGRIDYPEVLANLGVLQENALQEQGAQTRLGRRLGTIFHQEGLSQIETGVLGGQWRILRQEADPNWELEWQVLEHDLHHLLQPEELRRYHSIEMTTRQNGERLLFVPTFYAMGLKSG